MIDKKVWDHRIFESIYYSVLHFFKGYEEFWNSIKPGIAHLPVQDLIDMTEKRDKYIELSKLVQRSKDKKLGNTDSKLPRTQSLKALQFLLEANKGRPM
jgi:hypothetical protein